MQVCPFQESFFLSSTYMPVILKVKSTTVQLQRTELKRDTICTHNWNKKKSDVGSRT